MQWRVEEKREGGGGRSVDEDWKRKAGGQVNRMGQKTHGHEARAMRIQRTKRRNKGVYD